MLKYLYPGKYNKWPEILCGLGGGALLALSFVLILCDSLGIKYTSQSSGLEDADQGIVSGFIACWNQASETLGRNDYIILSQLFGEGATGEFLIASTLAISLLAFLAIRSGYSITMLVFVLPPLLLTLFTSVEARPLFWVFLAVAILNAIVIMRQKGNPVNSLISLLLVSLISFSSVGALSELGIVNSGTLSKENKGLRTEIENRYYGSDPLGHGDLYLKARNVTEETALVVTMSRPTSMYLKGFTGSLFDGRGWKDLGSSTYYRWKPIGDVLEQEGFRGVGQLAQAAELTLGEEVEGDLVRVEIKNLSADSRFAFVPYDLHDRGTLDNVSLKGSIDFHKSAPGRFKEYSFTAYGNQVERWTDVAGSFYVKALGEDRDEAIEKYRINESQFNTFVYEYYTYISQGDRALLGEFIGSPGDQSLGHLDYKKAINAIRTYLEDNFVYGENLYSSSYYREKGGVGDEISSVNALNEFLNSGIGYDIHYATLATLMFRYYGIPARYVEGYLITPEDRERMTPLDESMYQVSIPRSNAHAWTEIYIDGIGFVPLEVCPEYYGIMREADMQAGISNEALVMDYVENYGGKAREEKEEEKDYSGGNDAPRYLAYIAILVASIPLLVFLILLLQKTYRLCKAYLKRRRLFFKDSPKRAVSGIYGYMEDLGYPMDEETVSLGNKAAYSLEEITEEDRNYMISKLKEGKKINGGRNTKARKASVVSSLLALMLISSFTLGGCNREVTGDEPAKDNPNTVSYLTEIAEELGDYLQEKVPNPGEEGSDTDWIVFALRKSPSSVPEEYFELYYDNTRARVKRAKGVLSQDKFTDYERTIIGLSSIGKDPRDVEGYDLIPYIDYYDGVWGQGINAVWYALMASKISDNLLENQDKYVSLVEESLRSGKYDDKGLTDYISIGIQALSFYSEDKRYNLKPLIEDSIDKLSRYQGDDGSMGNAESTAMAVIALTMNGVNPLEDQRFIKNGKTLVDGLLLYRISDGSFSHVEELEQGDLLASQQVLMALDALLLQAEGKKLYD